MKKKSSSKTNTSPQNLEKNQIINDCIIGKNTIIYNYVNLYGCTIGENCLIGTFVEIQKGATIGNNCRVQSHSFICEGVTLEDNVFIGHGVIFINDNHPSVEKTLNKTWTLKKVLIKKGATIGSGAVILGGVTVGKKALIGAGAVVTKDVPDGTTVVGNPAKIIK